MRKWGLFVMLVAMLATPVLACGFPIPVTVTTSDGTFTMTEPVCAEGEDAASCQLRQDAYAQMAALESGSVTDMEMTMFVSGEEGAAPTEIAIMGGYDFKVNPDSELGMDLAATIETGSMSGGEGTESLDNAMLRIVGDVGYSSEDGGETWQQEDMSDSDTMAGLALILGLGGMGMDLFGSPAAFSVETGDDMDMMGQTMHVQTLTVDLQALMMDADALGAMMASGAELGGDSAGTEDLGDPQEMAMMAAMMLPFMAGTEFTTTVYIGADDGYIHYVEDNYVFNLDLSGFDETAEPMSMTYTLKGTITNHNGAVEISAPEGAEEGGGLFGDLGGGGLGDGLFGG